MAKSISVFGLGAMGLVLAEVFLKKGYKTTVWNRSPEKAKDLVANGAHLATTVAEGLEASDLIVVCLLNHEAVNTTIKQALPSLKGRTVVNLTNGTSDHAREMSALVIAQGGRYIHGGIMGVPPMVAAGVAFLIYSGPLEVYQSVEQDIALLGTPRHLDAEVGTASLYDLALLSGMYGLFTGFIHAVSLVRSQPGKDKKDINVSEFVNTLLVPWLSHMNEYTKILADQIDADDYSSKSARIVMQIPAIDNIVQQSKANGISPEPIAAIQKLFILANDRGFGNDDLSQLVNHNDAKEN
ncbi:hypothetical protein DFQ27_009029 [Actinomortierella ambigua]|uniref:6-phosphogluconate dehydrogenase NADP-binding domain-containing protein n=1 Tax=Actinomortierella ambigua TaxID=1343610 RepID=A0A9P6PSC4_9FUNG|nr:hypothetical protein DFQ27_009029 [Actinomortierella ambigua]